MNNQSTTPNTKTSGVAKAKKIVNTKTQLSTKRAKLTTIAWNAQNLTNSSFSKSTKSTGTTNVGPKSTESAAAVSFLSPVPVVAINITPTLSDKSEDSEEFR